MEQKDNLYISVAYKLYDITDNKQKLIEETSEDKPFVFISGFGTTLEEFENNLVGLQKGSTFDFILPPDKAYGEYVDSRVVELDKQIFTINGKFDTTNIYPNAIVPLQNEDGNHFLGRVVSIGKDKVCIDLNHPLAGMTLNFKGNIRENRLATNAEIEQMARILSGEVGCGGHCSGCGSHCSDGCNGCGNEHCEQ